MVWEAFPKEVQGEGQLAFQRRIGADPLWRGSPCPVKAIGPEVQTRTFAEGNRAVAETTTPVGSLRESRITSDSGNTTFLVEHPLKTPEDVMKAADQALYC